MASVIPKFFLRSVTFWSPGSSFSCYKTLLVWYFERKGKESCKLRTAEAVLELTQVFLCSYMVS